MGYSLYDRLAQEGRPWIAGRKIGVKRALKPKEFDVSLPRSIIQCGPTVFGQVQRLISSRWKVWRNVSCGVDSGMLDIGRQLAKADFADEFKILSLQSALGGRKQYELKWA